MAFVAKTPLAGARLADDAAAVVYEEKSMWGGKTIAAGDCVFLFDSETQGGSGLVAKAIVIAAARGVGSRVRVEARPVALARRSLGRRELKPFREERDDRPEVELARKLYRQATNKTAEVSDAAAAFLETYF